MDDQKDEYLVYLLSDLISLQSKYLSQFIVLMYLGSTDE